MSDSRLGVVQQQLSYTGQSFSPIYSLHKRSRLTISFSLICAFAIIGVFLPPSSGSPFAYETTHVRWYIVPTVGLGTLVLGYIYYFGFAVVLPRLKHQVRVVEREPVIVRQFGRPDGEWVQVMELVEFWWSARGQPSPATDSMVGSTDGDHELGNVGIAH